MLPRHAVLLNDSQRIRRLYDIPFVGFGSGSGLHEGESFVAGFASIPRPTLSDFDVANELWDETHDSRAFGQVNRASVECLVDPIANRSKLRLLRAANAEKSRCWQAVIQ